MEANIDHSIINMRMNVTGQNLSCRCRRAYQEIMIDDRVRHFVRQDFLVHIVNIDINGVLRECIPGPDLAGLPVELDIGGRERLFVSIKVDIVLQLRFF